MLASMAPTQEPGVFSSITGSLARLGCGLGGSPPLSACRGVGSGPRVGSTGRSAVVEELGGGGVVGVRRRPAHCQGVPLVVGGHQSTLGWGVG